MKRLVVGLVLGLAIGSAAAMGGVRDLVVKPGGRAMILPGRQTATGVTFAGIDLRCTYSILLAQLGPEPKGSPVLFCSHKSVPGSVGPTALQERLVIISKYRYSITNNRGETVYTVRRTP